MVEDIAWDVGLIFISGYIAGIIGLSF